MYRSRSSTHGKLAFMVLLVLAIAAHRKSRGKASC